MATYSLSYNYQFASFVFATSTAAATKESVEAGGQAEEHSLDARVVLALSRMHAEFEAACYRLAKALPRNRLRLVFLINNFDLIISVLSVGNFLLSKICNNLKYTSV